MSRSYRIPTRSYKEGVDLYQVKTSFVVVSDGVAILRAWYTSKKLDSPRQLYEVIEKCAQNLHEMDGWVAHGQIAISLDSVRPIGLQVELRLDKVN